MNFDEAAEALAAANQESAASDASNPLLASTPEQSTSPATPEHPAPPAPAPAAPEEPASDFNRADFESLVESIEDPALKEQVLKLRSSLLGDYTRKTQEIAPWRELAEQGIDPETAARAAQWYEAMSDPTVARQFYDHLGQTLSGYGLLEQGGAVDVPGMDDGEMFENLLDDPNDPSHPLAQRLSDMEQHLAQLEWENAAHAEAQRIQDAENALREAHPEWEQEDIDRVYELAFAHDYDLTKAASAYEAWEQRNISRYMERKGSVPSAGHIAATGPAQQPVDASSFIKENGEIDFERLTRAATEMYEQSLG